jgi:hypothetical protein
LSTEEVAIMFGLNNEKSIPSISAVWAYTTWLGFSFLRSHNIIFLSSPTVPNISPSVQCQATSSTTL